MDFNRNGNFDPVGMRGADYTRNSYTKSSKR